MHMNSLWKVLKLQSDSGWSISTLVHNGVSGRRSRLSSLQSGSNGCGLVEEELFNRMLCVERKRTERTGDPFVLMLLDLNGLLRDLSPARLANLCKAIRSVIRDSDFEGWYHRPAVIGMIFTTLRSASREAIEDALGERTRATLSEVLTPAERARINVTFHFFPEESGNGPFMKSDKTLYPDLTNGKGARKLHEVMKRTIDIVGSLCALILFSPLFLVIAVLIKSTSKGPVLFKQRRLGKFGREFYFLKFRSMVVNNDPHIHQEYIRKLIEQKAETAKGVYKIVNDPRVTPVGRFLRKSSLDELPQFINVLRGEMSLVGPRPPIPYEIYSYKFWHRRRVTEVKPGITGLWQVYGRSRTTFDEMVRLDIRYIRRQSIWLDLKIILKTPFAVLSGDGAY